MWGMRPNWEITSPPRLLKSRAGLAGTSPHTEPGEEVVHVHPGVNQPVPRVAGDDLLVRFAVQPMLVVDLAHQFFQHVFQRDHPRRAAEFIQHDGHLRAALAKGLQQPVDGHRGRHQQRRPHHLPQVHGAIQVVLQQEVLDVDEADHVVHVALVDGQAGEAGHGHGADDFFRRGVDVQGVDFDPRTHDFPHRAIPQPQRPAGHHLLGRLEQAFAGAGLDEMLDVFDRHRRSGEIAPPQQGQHRVGGRAHQPHHRTAGDRQPMHRSGHDPRQPLGVASASRLGTSSPNTSEKKEIASTTSTRAIDSAPWATAGSGIRPNCPAR